MARLMSESMDRRAFVRQALTLAGTASLAPAVHAWSLDGGGAGTGLDGRWAEDGQSWQGSLLNQSRTLRLFNPRSRERARVTFWTPEQGLIRDGYRHCSWLLRDVTAGVWCDMDVALLNKLFGLQAWLDYYGVDPEMEILSGLRTPKTNDATEGASRVSRHLRGQAADIRMLKVGASTLGKMARMFGPGGVGFYVSRNFVHVDTDRTRVWAE